MQSPLPAVRKRRVVIVGAGFAGLTAAKALAEEDGFEITVVDRHNYHLFQPLLYQVATAGLSPADIASPIRSILRRQANARVVLAEVSGIDLRMREVLAEGWQLSYDYLIIATGARHAYFGHDDWARYAPGLKRIDDATYLRRRILLDELRHNPTVVEQRFGLKYSRASNPIALDYVCQGRAKRKSPQRSRRS